MLNRRTLWTLAVAEIRSCSRLARTWVFIAIAFIFCGTWYWDMVQSSMWPSPPGSLIDDRMTARYAIASMMNGFVAIFCAGMIILAFDIRARDVHNRVAEVVDSLPVSNIEVILGRLAGIFLLLLIPCLVFLAVLTGFETVSQLLDSRFRLGVQPLSVLSLVTWNLIPNLVFYGTLVACLAALIRFRLVVATIALGVLIGLFWLEGHIPVQFQETLSQFPSGALVPSDLAPVFVTPAILGNKCVILLVSIALVLFATSALPRTEKRRRLHSILGVIASGIAFVTCFSLIARVSDPETQQDQWLNAHQQYSPTSFPDVQHIQGNFELVPGRRINLDVTLTVHTPVANTTDSVIFSLNPGYTIQELFVDGEATENFDFESGILQIPANLLPEFSHKIRIRAYGEPDDRFAYLDQARNFLEMNHRSVRSLGLRNSIFHRDFVALMPGVVWYPISGVVVDRDQLEAQNRDLFTSELTVTVPRNWQVAMVGKREIVEKQKLSAFQFTTGEPVPEIALIASNFDQRSTNIEGVGFEILFHRNHLQNLDALAPFTDQIYEWVADRIKNARNSSLEYPYDTFYIVEVPNNLRIYGGGWRMDSVLQPPGMMLIRESGFPTVQFKNVIVREHGISWLSKDEQDTRIFHELQRYFGNDLQGGSPFAGFARNFVSNQVSASQRGATVLQFLIDQLTKQLITHEESLSIISASDFDNLVGWLRVGQTPGIQSSPSYVAKRTRMHISVMPSTWNVMDRIALFDLDFEASPISSFRVLLTKTHALARSMIDYYGAEKVGVFLKQLSTEYSGRNFTLAELLKIASEVGLEFEDWVLPWLEDTILPGYLVDTPTVAKLGTRNSDDVQYQTTFVVHNAEPMPGLVRVFWAAIENENYEVHWPSGEFSRSEPLFITGHHSKRIAIHSYTPLAGIWIEPFLAHNRAPFEVQIPAYDKYAEQEGPPLPFVADVDWQPSTTQSIVIDDLDPGFSIVSRASPTEEFADTLTASASSDINDDYVQGLRVNASILSNEWSRRFDVSSYGTYMRTYTRTSRGDQSSAARFSATLPSDGRWTLDFFVPKPAFSRGWYYSQGFFSFQTFMLRAADPHASEEHYTLRIKDGNSEWIEEFDIANARSGWNKVRTFDLGSTEVDVYLSDWAGHEEVMVYADAIRWTPVDSE